MNQQEFEKYITDIPNFPKEGVTFKDITPLLENKFDELITAMGNEIPWSEVDAVIGIESRGFILGSALAAKYNKGFVPMRKKGKLPPPVIGEEYALEYGTDKLELKVNEAQKNVVIVDDVLATGGTLKAAISLCERNHYHVKHISMLINLKFLNNMSEELDHIHSVITYE